MSYNASFVNALKEALNGLRTVHMVGEEWVSYVGDIPAGGVPYCGQEVNRSTYSALWAYAQAKGLVKSESEWQSLYNAQGGNVAYYSSGNGSSTFRMPRLVGYVRGASSQSESGSYVKEGLPNITGMAGAMSNYLANNLVYNGAFATLSTTKSVASSGITGTPEVDFDASRSNSIYGNSSHVTPETSVVLYGVYAFGEIGNVDALDALAIASALARVEANMVDKTSAHIVESWSDGSLWYRKYSDGWVEQGGAGSTVVVSGDNVISLPIEFVDTSYVVTGSSNDRADICFGVNSKGTTYFNCGLSQPNKAWMSGKYSWKAEGYAK